MAIIGVSGYAGSGKDTVGKLIQLVNIDKIPEGKDIEEIVNNYSEHQWWLEEESGWEIKKFAGKLKEVASILTGISIEKFEDQEFKMTDLGKEWSYHYPGEYYDDGAPVMVAMSVRQFLQKLGTEGLREGLHENTWVNALMADYKCTWKDPDPIPKNDYTITYRENYGETSLIHYGGGSEAEVFNHEIVEPNWIITDTRFPNEAKAIKNAGGIVIRVDRPGVSAINAHPSETGLDNWNFDYRISNGSDLTGLLFTIGSILRKESLI